MTQGILYLATGPKFVEEAKRSAASAKDVMPEIPITLMSDQNPDSALFDTVLDIENPRQDGGDRVLHMLRSPYDRTLFVDTDIYFYSEIYELFDLLDEFDLAVASNGQFFEALDHHGNQIPESFPEFNGGVILYADRESVTDFQQRWKQEFLTDANEGIQYNQPSLRKSIYESNIRFTTLPRRYNCIFRRPGQVHGEAKVFHGRLYELDSYGASKDLDIEDIIEVINGRSDNRVYYQSGGSLRIKPGQIDRIKNALYYNGTVSTIKKCLREVQTRFSQ